jgi:hypothetical protein
VEIALDGAVILCNWVFTGLADNRTRLTQRIILEGEEAASYRDDVDRTFAATLAPGMNRIAIAIDQAYAREHSHR